MRPFLTTEPIHRQEMSTSFRYAQCRCIKGARNLFVIQWRTSGAIEIEQVRSDSFAPECNIEIKTNAIACERQRREDGGKPAVDLQIDDSIDPCALDQRGS